jgi:hypothetical protein
MPKHKGGYVWKEVRLKQGMYSLVEGALEQPAINLMK